MNPTVNVSEKVETFGQLTVAVRQKLIKRYTACFVAQQQPTFHRYMWRMWLLEKEKKTERPRRLNGWWIEQHLLGKFLVAPRWTLAELYRFAVVDLDYPLVSPFDVSARMTYEQAQHAAADEFVHRVQSVARAVKPAKCLYVRSSSSHGLHLYLFFDKAYSANAIRAVLIARLKTHGIEVKPGLVEIWPNNSALRLPFGKQSHVVSAKTLKVKFPNQRGSKQYRDTKSDILYSVDFAKQHAVSLRVLGSGVAHISSNNYTLPIMPATRCTTAPPSVKPPPQSSRLSTRNPSFWAEIEASRNGITGYGQRYQEGSLQFYNFVKRFSPADALKKYEDWLRTGDHKSKDLESDHEGTIQRMLRDARASVPKLAGGVRAKTVSLSKEVERLRERPRWRDRLNAELIESDRTLIARIGKANSWMKKPAETLLGIFRLLRRKHGGDFCMSMCSRTLQRIAGGRSRRVRPNDWPERYWKQAPYRKLLAWFDQQNIVSMAAGYKPAVHCRLYFIHPAKAQGEPEGL